MTAKKQETLAQANKRLEQQNEELKVVNLKLAAKANSYEKSYGALKADLKNVVDQNNYMRGSVASLEKALAISTGNSITALAGSLVE